MGDWYCNAHGIKDCECYEADLVKRIAELEAEVDMLKCAAFDQADKREKLEAERDRLLKVVAIYKKYVALDVLYALEAAEEGKE